MNTAAARSRRSPWRLSIAAYLTLGLGGLTFVAVASVLGLTVYASFLNTTELLEDKSRLLLGAMVSRIETYLDPARASADYMAGVLESGEIARHDHARLSLTLRAVIGSVPQVRALLYLDRDGTEVVGARQPGASKPPYASGVRVRWRERSWPTPADENRARPSGARRNIRRPAPWSICGGRCAVPASSWG